MSLRRKDQPMNMSNLETGYHGGSADGRHRSEARAVGTVVEGEDTRGRPDGNRIDNLGLGTGRSWWYSEKGMGNSQFVASKKEVLYQCFQRA